MSCDWPVDRSCLPDLPPLDDPPADGQQAAYDAALASRNAAEDVAVAVLWALSGRQFGVCETTIRPCPEGDDWSYRFESPGSGYFGYGGYGGGVVLLGWDGADFVNLGCGCMGRCKLSGPRMIHLPGPVYPPDDDHPFTVTIADGVLDPSEWSLEGDRLYRKTRRWPSQHLGRPLGERETWSVDYWRGITPPAGSAKMVGRLAAEFYAACTDGKCRLPRNVVSTVRQGVSVQFDPSKIYADGKTGLPEVDMWLAAINPHALLSAPSVI